MLTLPEPIIAVLVAFAPLFSRPVFAHAVVLLIGSILTPGKRTVTSALRVMGLSQTPHFQTYHRVLNRARWSGKHAAAVLLRRLIAAFAPDGTLVFGMDTTLERRRGDKIKAKGIYRDAARSSKEVFVKSSGLRWLSVMLLADIPWAGRVWALPFLTALCPSERYHQQQKRHKTTLDWAKQMLFALRRWLPERDLVVVGDGEFAALNFLAACRPLARPITFVTRLRLDAALYEPAPVYAGKGRPRKKGARLPTLQQVAEAPSTVWTTVSVPRWYSQREREVEIVSGTAVWYHSGKLPVALRWVLIRDPLGKFATQALLCTEPATDPVPIISWFVRRWQMETTFQEVRTYLGVETQRQWSDLAIARTTPALLGLFSLVTLFAKPWMEANGLWVRQASWYPKKQATFSDTLALVRYHLWRETTFCTAPVEPDSEKLATLLLDRMTETLCYAA